MRSTISARRCWVIVAAAAATALAGAAPAQAAPSTSPMHCNQIASSSDPGINNLLALLGIIVPAGTPVGLNCTPASNGSSDVNFCATNDYGIVVVGTRPDGHTCQ